MDTMATILETNVIFPLHTAAFSPLLLGIPVLLMAMEEFTGATPFRMVELEIHGQTVTWILANTVGQLCLFVLMKTLDVYLDPYLWGE